MKNKERSNNMWYIGEDDKEYSLRYGDEVIISPLEENNTELDCFCYEIKNLRTGKTAKVCDYLECMLNNYTAHRGDVFEIDVPKKPISEFGDGNKKYKCPNCEEKVYNDESVCDNCMQVLDWEE